MIYGYARVSTDGQSVEAQVATLRGCLKSFRGLSKSAYLQSGTLDSKEFQGLELS